LKYRLKKGRPAPVAMKKKNCRKPALRRGMRLYLYVYGRGRWKGGLEAWYMLDGVLVTRHFQLLSGEMKDFENEREIAPILFHEYFSLILS
jgi:hypothetical protein